MINVELSGIWSQVSLPGLLGKEKLLFDAHLRVRSDAPDSPNGFGWLDASESVTAKMLHTVRKSAEKIRESCDYLLVIGSGGSFSAARAAVALLGTDDACKLIFTGCDLSSQAWLDLCKKIEGKDVCLQIISPYGTEPETCIASRAIRWMMERRYGAEAKHRIYVSAMAQTPMAQMANEEGYTLLPMPQEPGGSDSALSSAALLPLAVAGIEPLDVLEGAAEAYKQYDIRAFENPVWLYTGARLALHEKHCISEILATLEPSMEQFGKWWRQYVLRHGIRGGVGLMPVHAVYTEELDLYESALGGQSRFFETVLHTADCGRKVGIEMDWKDYDGLGYLSETSLETVREKTVEALLSTHADLQLPIISIECPKPDAKLLGELFYFFELSNTLFALSSGLDPFSPNTSRPTRRCAEQYLGKTEM